MYVEDNSCCTCHVVKPARSKHCAVYDRCIFKFDHFCAWTNNAVGGLNHRYFLLFLLSICVMCVEGVRILIQSLLAISHVHQLHLLHYLDDYGHPQPITFRVLMQTLFMQFPRLVFLVAALVVITLFISAFAAYHLYLVFTNQTTNERYKKHDLKKSDILVENPYNKGLFSNIREEFFPFWIIEKTSVSSVRKKKKW